MRFTLEEHGALNVVSRHAPGAVHIGGTTLEQPFILSATSIDTGLAAATPADLGMEQVEQLLALQPQLVIVGATGGFPRVPAQVRAALLARGIGVESMELGAACRTYNLLVQEGRAAVALLFPQPRAGEKGA